MSVWGGWLSLLWPQSLVDQCNLLVDFSNYSRKSCGCCVTKTFSHWDSHPAWTVLISTREEREDTCWAQERSGRKEKKVKLLGRVWLFATPWTVAYQAPPSMEFSRQEYWSGLPFPSPGHLPDPGLSLSVENLVEQRHLWVGSLNYSSKPRVRCVAKAFIHVDSHQSTASFVKGKRGKRREVLAHRKWVRGVDVDVSL